MKSFLIFCVGFYSLAVFACAEHLDCDKATSTMDINQCAAMELEKAQQQLTDYLDAALQQHGEDAELLAAMAQAQQDWERYANSQCQTVYTQWRDGSIRTVAALTCKTQLTKERTLQLWQHFLSPADTTAALLPEPSF